MIEDFFSTVTELKNIDRKGWQEKLNIKNPESVADHSFAMTVFAMILAEQQKLNVEKVMKMALIHDLAESVIGDFTPDEISREKKYELELKTMKQILDKLPQDLRLNYQNLWEEFQKMESEEAIFVHEIDKLEMAFQAKKYLVSGHNKENVKQFFDSAKSEIKNSEIIKILNKLL